MPPRVYSKTYKVPRRPFEKDRLDHELKLCGEFGLRNKREVRGTLDEKIWSDFQRPAREKAKREEEEKWTALALALALALAAPAMPSAAPGPYGKRAGSTVTTLDGPLEHDGYLFSSLFSLFLFSLHWWR